MKVALFSNTAWSVYNFRRNLIAALKTAGYTVLVVVPPDEEYVPMLEALGCKVTQIPIDNMGASFWRDGLLWLRYLRYFLETRPQVTILFTIKPVIYGATAARLMGLHTISVITGLGTAFIRDDWLARFVMFLYRVALKFPKRVFFLNKDDMQLFLEAGIVNFRWRVPELIPGEGVDVNRYSVGYWNGENVMSSPLGCLSGSGVDIDRYTESKNNVRPFTPDRMVFLLVARMIRDKGIVEFVDAARLLKQRYPLVCFQLLGPVGVSNRTAISQKEIDEWVASGVVDYLGVASDIRPFLSKSDCVVLPSYREGIPRALLEAAAMNRPIVATDVPGCRDIVDNGINGFLCSPRDAPDLADKMERMMRLSQIDYYEMGQRGREKVSREFADCVVIAQYLEAIAAVSPRGQQVPN